MGQKNKGIWDIFVNIIRDIEFGSILGIWGYNAVWIWGFFLLGIWDIFQKT